MQFFLWASGGNFAPANGSLRSRSASLFLSRHYDYWAGKKEREREWKRLGKTITFGPPTFLSCQKFFFQCPKDILGKDLRVNFWRARIPFFKNHRNANKKGIFFLNNNNKAWVSLFTFTPMQSHLARPVTRGNGRQFSLFFSFLFFSRSRPPEEMCYVTREVFVGRRRSQTKIDSFELGELERGFFGPVIETLVWVLTKPKSSFFFLSFFFSALVCAMGIWNFFFDFYVSFSFLSSRWWYRS